MNISPRLYSKLVHTEVLLKITYGLVFIAAGADKFFNYLVQWEQYLSPYVMQFIPLTASQIMMAVGVIEIVIGLWILLRCSCVAAYAAMLWLFLIVANLLSMHAYYDIAVRDAVMAVGALALARLSAIKDEAEHVPAHNV